MFKLKSRICLILCFAMLMILMLFSGCMSGNTNMPPDGTTLPGNNNPQKTFQPPWTGSGNIPRNIPGDNMPIPHNPA